MIQPQIMQLPELKLAGLDAEMSIETFDPASLWRRFRPRVAEVSGRSSAELISLSIYPPTYFEQFDASAKFTKWAAVQTNDLDAVPADLRTLAVPAGQYAVFQYQGPSGDSSIFEYIYTSWLPTSGYRLDDRPHFEIFGENYDPRDPNAEEDIYIPILS